MGERVRIGVFVSGSGRTLLHLHERMGAGALRAEVGVVVASRECLGAERARGLGLPVEVVAGDISAERFGGIAREHGLGLVALAGYLRLVSFPAEWRGRVVNIHPALLPSFGGKGMYGHHVHEAVLRAGCKVSGCTVHFCDDRYDTGAILLQRCCPVLEDDTAETLASRVFEVEKGAYVDALCALVGGRVRLEERGGVMMARVRERGA